MKKLLHKWKAECEHKRREPVGEYADGHGRAALVLLEALGRVDERNGSEADGEAHDEDDNAHDAQIGEYGIVAKGEAHREQNEVDDHERHGKDDEWLAAEAIDERHAADGGQQVDKTGGHDAILDVLLLDHGAFEDALRVEEDGVDAAQLLCALQDERGDERPADLALAQQLPHGHVVGRVVVERLAVRRRAYLVAQLFELEVDIGRATQKTQSCARSEITSKHTNTNVMLSDSAICNNNNKKKIA